LNTNLFCLLLCLFDHFVRFRFYQTSSRHNFNCFLHVAGGLVAIDVQLLVLNLEITAGKLAISRVFFAEIITLLIDIRTPVGSFTSAKRFYRRILVLLLDLRHLYFGVRTFPDVNFVSLKFRGRNAFELIVMRFLALGFFTVAEKFMIALCLK